MRLHFPNLTRPKKSAKVIVGKLGLSLSLAHTAVSRISGYCDWHDLEQNHSKHAAFELDQNIEYSDFIERQTRLSLALAEELGISDGDAQHALANSRLTGDRPVSLPDQIAIRLKCWRQTVLPPAGRRARGAIGRVKSPGWHEVVILRSFDKPTTVIAQKNVGHIADFEYVSPRNPPSMFLPMRLYLPYGYWVEDDGAKVLFSRDYKPMWRIRSGAEPERLEPWLRIKWRDQFFMWDGVQTPWNSPTLKRCLEDSLSGHGIRTLPIWADSLPLLIQDDNLTHFSHAIEPLKLLRNGDLKTAT
jgi:hypothetical protein